MRVCDCKTIYFGANARSTSIIALTKNKCCHCASSWESQELSVIFRCHLGCYVADCACPLRRLRKRKKTGMERSGPTPTAIRQASWPDRSGTGGAPVTAAERFCCWTASHYIRALARVCLYISQNVLQLDVSILPRVSGLLAGECRRKRHGNCYYDPQT